MDSINEVYDIYMYKHSNIKEESRSRAGKTIFDYHLVNMNGTIKGKTNEFKLRIPEILHISERLESGETSKEIHEDYKHLISITSFNETMKKYYVGLLDRVIWQYENLQQKIAK